MDAVAARVDDGADVDALVCVVGLDDVAGGLIDDDLRDSLKDQLVEKMVSGVSL